MASGICQRKHALAFSYRFSHCRRNPLCEFPYHVANRSD